MRTRSALTSTLGICLILASVSADAALVSRAGGQAYYDTVLNITWLANANLAESNTFGLPRGDDVIAESGEISTIGRMYWDTAQAWIAAMNAANYFGSNNWRLPTVVDTDDPYDADDLGGDGCGFDVSSNGGECGYNVKTKTGDVNAYEVGQTVYSEMAHLYYVTLGNLADQPACRRE
jgi:hypothetical protein